MKIKLQRHAKIPVYKQMVASIIAQIESGEVGVGERLPSIRELSEQLGVNPNTTAKVFRELELRGFIESKVGSGSYVLPKDELAAAAAKKAHVDGLFDRMLSEARSLQLSEQDVIHFLKLRTET